MSEQNPFEPQILGQNTETFIVEGNENISQLIIHMAQQAKEHINIFSAELNHRIFDKAEVSEALSDFARKNRKSEIRILVKDTARIVQLGHRLLNLSHKLPSFVHIQVVNKDYQAMDRMFIVMDNVGYIDQPDSDVEKVKASYRSIPQGPENHKLFDQIWNKSKIDVNLRSLKM